jgi:hypothetical protein
VFRPSALFRATIVSIVRALARHTPPTTTKEQSGRARIFRA